ncbi:MULTISPECIES: HDOD domain-containing protein [unclassified Janthinobacterium]|uniref:HDOD domain-containing protein n=1 Tax=unclassified Janthinobacterium TaxID=2610881 RepID=UPI0003456C73|nr:MULTISPECIES: HDOD domain-containing protein [unclassified Janthinobacterium]MEC5159007.1 HD-like signal output (HDOD) protein [Janthinobacterium sp. CG_S6]
MFTASSSGSGGAERPVRGQLLHKLCGDEGLFALGASVARVVQLASSDDEGTQSLAYYVLSDVALTQKILRLSNTPTYRTANGTAVTTISRAISLLGFNNVKTTALAMLLVDTLLNSKHAHSVRAELEAALCASLLGRELARLSFYQGAEEASIGALFKNIGPLLIASQEHERFREICALVAAGEHNQSQASQMILGSSYDVLSAAVLREWKIPDVIVRSLSTLPPGPQKLAVNRQEWMRQVATFSIDAAKLLGRPGEAAETPEARALLARFGVALAVDQALLRKLFETVRAEMASLLESMNLAPQAEDDGEGGLPNVLVLATMDAGDAGKDAAYPSGKPTNARELLLAGVQEVTQMRAGGQCKMNELIQTVLETLYRSMGFRYATVCLKDARSGLYRARLSFGEKHAERQAGFQFPIAPVNDLFHLAMENEADLMIADAGAQKIRDLLPPWHRALLPDARSFIVLPLVVQSVQLGLFYADRIHPAPEGVPPDEASLIRALKGQVLVALTP